MKIVVRFFDLFTKNFQILKKKRKPPPQANHIKHPRNPLEI